MSIDGADKVNDYMRVYTKTHRSYKNFNRFCTEIPHAEMTIHTVHTNLSVSYMREFYEGLSDRIERVDTMSHFAITYPYIYSISNLPESYRKRVLEKLEGVDTTEDTIGWAYRRAIDLVKEHMERPFNPAHWSEFLLQNRDFDSKLRGETNLIDVLNV